MTEEVATDEEIGKFVLEHAPKCRCCISTPTHLQFYRNADPGYELFELRCDTHLLEGIWKIRIAPSPQEKVMATMEDVLDFMGELLRTNVRSLLGGCDE